MYLRMSINTRKNWKEYIILRGIGQTAEDLSVSKEIVRLWAKKNNVPAGTNLRRFVSLARTEMGEDDFAAFILSLTRDIFGPDVCGGTCERAAVNE